MGIDARLVKRSRLRARSDKAIIEGRARREFVDVFLRAHPVCSWPECRRDAVHVHEPLTRARGGSVLDPANAVGLCFDHHRWVHDNPAAAEERGLLIRSWNR